MACFSLGLNRALAPWQIAGVKMLLCDDAKTVEALKNHRAAAARQNSVQPQVSAPVQSQDRYQSVPLTRPRQQIPPAHVISRESASTANSIVGRAHSVPTQKLEVPAPLRHPLQTPSGTENSEPARSSVQNVETWPASWKAYLEKNRVRNPKVIWTYPELLDDLDGRGDKKHGEAFRKLLKDLALPQGTHAFWPMTPPHDTYSGDAQMPPTNGYRYEAAAFFTGGIEVLRPETVILICDIVPAYLDLPPMRTRLPIIHRGTRYLLLYNIEQITADALGNAPRHAGLVRFLQTILRGV